MSQDLRNKESILRNSGFQTILASLLCIVLGLLVGFIVLLVINPLETQTLLWMPTSAC